MNTPKYLIGLSLALVGAGITLAAPLGVSWLERQKALRAPSAMLATPPALSERSTAASGTPRHITVANLGIDLAVADGTYDATTGAWTLSENSAFFATPTNPTNSEQGNTLIYGHNIQKVFGRLSHIQIGTEATVTTDNGYAFTYTYTTNEVVGPTDVSLFAYSGKPRLTLQTCSGMWSQNRQLFYFELKSYRKI